jgi:hypothetical protein
MICSYPGVRFFYILEKLDRPLPSWPGQFYQRPRPDYITRYQHEKNPKRNIEKNKGPGRFEKNIRLFLKTTQILLYPGATTTPYQAADSDCNSATTTCLDRPTFTHYIQYIDNSDYIPTFYSLERGSLVKCNHHVPV